MKHENGFISLGYIIVICLLMVATLVSFSKFVPDEAHQTKFSRAEAQAYFLAQRAILEKGFSYFAENDPSTMNFEQIIIDGYKVPEVGACKRIVVSKIHGMRQDNPFETSIYYNIRATGVGTFFNSAGAPCNVERSVDLLVKLRFFSDYLYLTNFERTYPQNEVVWFWGPGRDTLKGRVHSNDYIAIKGRPVFLDRVSTSEDQFRIGEGYDPYFRYPPQFNAPKVLIPETAASVRAHSALDLSDNDGRWMTRIILRGGEGIDIIQYNLGTGEPDGPNIQNQDHLPAPNNLALFVDGQTEVLGILSGRITIGCSKDMWLIDNVKYSQTNNNDGIGTDQTTDMLGLVSEKNIIIKNTYANGKNNQERGADIIVNAALLALKDSFTFQYQNDEGDAYQGPTPDERGTIYLWGAVSQNRRGYVHRSNHQGTGYNKQYVYDNRFNFQHPPFFPQVNNEKGGTMFDIVGWHEESPR